MRLTGAALVTAAGLLAGLGVAERMRARAELLAELCRMLDMMEYELGRFRTPMPELFEKLAGLAEGRTGRFCAAGAEGLTHIGQRDMAQIWQDALEELPRPAGDLMRPLGPVLGRYGAEEQLRAVEGCCQAMERARDEARCQLRERGRVAVGVAAAGAAAVAVLLL